MKNIKHFLLVALIITLVFSICGCSIKNKALEYHVLEVGEFDNLDGGNHISEFPLWSVSNLNAHEDTQAPAEATVVFNGVTYHGKYDRTSITVPNTYFKHRYNGEKIFFNINADTGALTDIMFIDELADKSTLSESECKKIADDIAKQYISIDEYKSETYTQTIRENSLYRFTYYREISGYMTSDLLIVSVDGNGNISSFGMNMINSFKDVQSISLDTEKSNEAIDNKLKQIYADNSNRISYNVKNTCLTRLEDDSCAIVYTISNDFDISSEGQKGSSIYSTLIQLLLTPVEFSKN